MDWNRIGEVAALVVEQGWSFFAVSLAVYYLGQTSKRLAERRGWRAAHEDEASWFDATLPVQPLISGALLMQVPFPVWDAIDGLDKDPESGFWIEVAARLAYGGLAGALCGQLFEMTQSLSRFVKKRLGVEAAGRASPTPVPAPAPAPKSKNADAGDEASSSNEER